MKLIHYYSGITLSLFVAVHLLNHLMIFHSEELHLDFMRKARKIYRNRFIETFLLLAVVVQIVTGINLVFSKWNRTNDIFSLIQICSGLYLALFLVFHVTAVMLGRYKLRLDTNLYYGAGVMNMWPHKLFYIPYYSLAILSFFFHVAAIHKMKMEKLVSLSPAIYQSVVIMLLGILVTTLIIFKMSRLKRIKIQPAVNHQKSTLNDAIQ